VRSPFAQGFQAHVIAKGANDACTAGSYGLRTGSTGGLEFFVYGPAGQVLVSPETEQTVFDNRWHFITGTFDRNTVRLFVDGVEVGSGTSGSAAFSIAYSAPDQRLAIGSYPAPVCNFSCAGEIDQPGIWSGALTASEVAQRFQVLNVPFTTETALTTAPAGSSHVGDPVLLRADVMANAGTAPTGSVEFFDGTASLGIVPLVSGRAELTVTTFTEGEHTLAALYSPLGFFELSGSLPVTHTVLPATPTDTVPPAVTVPEPMTAEATSAAGAIVTFTATAVDDIDGALTPTCSPASGATFPLGATTVTCSATDAAGNTGTASFAVTVVDTTPPALTVPAPIAATASGPAGTAVTFTASAVDLVDGAVVPACVPASGSVFPLGPTTVTCTATDSRSNSASKSFTVTVTLVDTTPPVVDVPADITAEATGVAGAVVAFTAIAVDNSDGPLTPACSPASGAMFPLGASTVTCSATDSHGNTGTASFKVKVTDTTPPTAPAWLPVTDLTAKTATLNWTAAEHAVGAPTYRIYEQIRKQSGPATWQLLAADLPGTSFTPSEFKQRNFEHVFYIVAVDAAGNPSGPSGELVVQLPKASGR
jgi:hypothetical protein